jgi:hypothetical protein
MDGNLQTLLGQMILLGDSILTSLDRALESDDLAKVHELVKQASEGMKELLNAARATQPRDG